MKIKTLDISEKNFKKDLNEYLKLNLKYLAKLALMAMVYNYICKED